MAVQQSNEPEMQGMEAFGWGWWGGATEGARAYEYA